MSKENNILKPIQNSGIEFFEQEISYIGLGGKKHPMLSAFCNMLISALLVFGSIFTLSGMFSLKVNNLVVGIVLALSVFVFSMVFYLPQKYKKIAVGGLMLIIVAVSGIGYNMLLEGFNNAFLLGKDAIYNAMYWTKNYTLDVASLKAGSTTFALIIVGVILSLGVTFFNRERVRFLLLVLITFPFFEIGAAFGCVPPYFAFSLLLAGWTATFAIYASSLVKRKKGQKKTTVKHNKAVGIGAVVAVITLLCFIATNTLLTLGGYTRDNGTKDLRLAIKDGVSNIYDLITGEDHDASMKDGRLYKYGDRVVKNRHHLTFTTTNLYLNPDGSKADVYLTGFIGEQYTGNTFTSFDNYGKYQEMFDAFEKYNLYPQSMTGNALQSIVDAGTDENIIGTFESVTISELRRKKNYAYTIAYCSVPEIFGYNYDLTIKPSNKSKYSYNAFIDPTNEYKILLSPLYSTQEYQYLRALYNDYVEKEYLQLPKNNEYLKALTEKITVDAYDDYAIADKIRYYLKDNTKYTNYVGEMPIGRDFVNYFLNENKKGYSAHYAATATLMLRSVGVPARYVEGFILRESDTKEEQEKKTLILDEIEKNGMSGYTLKVTDKEAHAWVEFYSKNYGWVRVEVTPGFYTGHLGETAPPSEGTNEDIFHYDENSDLVTLIPPTEEPENEVVELTLFEKFVEWLKKFLPVFLKILAIIASVGVSAMLLTLIVLSIRLFIVREIRERKLKQGGKKAVLALYKYYNRLLLFEKIKNTETLPYLRYAKKAAKESRALQEESSLFLMNIFLKTAFSEHEIITDEVISARLCIEEYKRALIKKLSFKEKIVFIFIKALA